MPSTLRTDVRGGEEPVFGRRRVRTTVVSLLAALVAFLSPALASSAHAAAAPTDFTGVSDWGWPTAAQATQLGSDGVHTVRAGLPWDWVEHTQGVRQWGGVDDLMTKAATNHYELLLVLNGCTAWACGGVARTEPTTAAGLAAYQDFVKNAVARYGAGGSFWITHPKLTPATVDWQVWNEVNVGADWPNPTTGGYAQFLAQISSTIKGVDPSARVVASGLAEFPADATGQTLTNFLTGLEQDPTFRGSADVVAIHGYAENPAGTVRVLDAARRVMLAAGDTRPLWVTELGWGTGGAPHPFNVDPATQAAYLSQTFTTMVGCRARWGLERAFWFSLQDVSGVGTEADYWGMHTGLYDVNGNAKPSLAAFEQFVGGREMPNGGGATCDLPGGADPVATTTSAGPAPRVSIVGAPKFVGPAGGQINFVTDMGNAGNAQCSLNGGAWAVCGTPYAIPHGVEGVNTLSVRAVNAGGIVGTPVTVSWTVDLTAPKTVFTKTPKRIVRHVVSARFGVRAVRLAAGATEVVTYQCSLNGSAFQTCTARYRVKAKKAGKGVLKVRAVDQAGNIDPKGATATFTVAKLHKNSKI